MALVKCPKCSNDVSTNAVGCPMCAYPIRRDRKGIIPTESTNSATNQPQWWRSWHVRGIALLFGSAFLAAPVIPAFPLLIGIAFLVLCIGAVTQNGVGRFRLAERIDATSTWGKVASRVLPLVPAIQNGARWMLRLNFADNWRIKFGLVFYASAGLTLSFVGVTYARANALAIAEAKRIAAERVAEEAERKRLESEANAKVASLTRDAEQLLKMENLTAAQQNLDVASKIQHATDLAPVHRLRTQIANMTDPSTVRAALLDLSDEAFQQLKQNGTIPAQFITTNEGLNRLGAKAVISEVSRVADVREYRLRASQEAERRQLPRASFAVLDEKLSDTPIKTQIEQHILVTGIPSRKELEAEALSRYRAAYRRRGFVYHNPPTNIFIYIYGTKEQADSGKGLWIAMIAKSYSDESEPKVIIEETRLAALSAQPQQRAGLTEQQRKGIFREIAAAENKAMLDARARIPDTRVREQVDLNDELKKAYKGAVSRKYNLSDDQVQDIVAEGVTNGWVY